MNLSAHLSRLGRDLQAGELRKLITEFGGGSSDMISLHAGLPPEASFPLASMSLTLADGTRIDVDETDVVKSQMQYMVPQTGWPPLTAWLEALTAEIHRPAGAVATAVTSGSTQAMTMLLALFLERGDSLLVEEFTYSHILECSLLPEGLQLHFAAVDEGGLIPSALRSQLESLKSDSSRPFPRTLYTIPVGQNPTGSSISMARRKEVYDICREHDILIIEDDPYFYIQWRPEPEAPLPGLLDLERGQSYLSLDRDGRVIRIDSLSKIMSPGLRIGWITASPAVVERCSLYSNGHTLGACGVMQAGVAALLRRWGDAGFHSHLQRIQGIYRAKAAAAARAAQESLGGLAVFQAPTAGMFLWIRLLHARDGRDVVPFMRRYNVVAVPGFVSHPRIHDPTFECPYLRVGFSYPSPEAVYEGVKRLAQALESHREEKGSCAT
ncbi:hypothetical protein H632_c1182p1 [Helicosporidium sp. ATCC 50920]|nr:hypothetical protein H632_c1182p1 [Helicosporidium sp. ATCC 50920]|eukprot:KDD74616.1 hypothetical protein H632_c1182p1 [Helicosporidium sp. ATCC 50920]